MIRVLDSADSTLVEWGRQQQQQEVENKLFSLFLSRHIVADVTDGVSAMVIFGRCVDCEHKLCYAHAMHLAVCDVLYK